MNRLPYTYTLESNDLADYCARYISSLFLISLTPKKLRSEWALMEW